MRESLMIPDLCGGREAARVLPRRGVSARLERNRQRSCGPAFSGISLAAANALLSFPSMRQIQPPRPRSRRSRSRAPARWSRPRRQRARQKLCGSYRPKLWSAPTGQPVLFRRSCCFLTERAAGMLAHPPHRRETAKMLGSTFPLTSGPRRRGD